MSNSQGIDNKELINTYKWQVSQDDKAREIIENTYLDAITININTQRSLVVTFITLSAGIIGFSLPVLNGSDLVKNPAFLIWGLLTLLVVLIYGLLYLRHILQSENKDLSHIKDFYSDLLSEQVEARNKYYFDPSEANLDIYNESIEKGMKRLKNYKRDPASPDYALDFISGTFTFALMLYVLSLIPFGVNILTYLTGK